MFGVRSCTVRGMQPRLPHTAPVHLGGLSSTHRVLGTDPAGHPWYLHRAPLREDRGALSLKAFPWKSGKPASSCQQGSAIIVREKEDEIMHGRGWTAAGGNSSHFIV